MAKAKVKAVEYNDIKGHLKETFNEFVADATKFGVDVETASQGFQLLSDGQS